MVQTGLCTQPQPPKYGNLFHRSQTVLFLLLPNMNKIQKSCREMTNILEIDIFNFFLFIFL